MSSRVFLSTLIWLILVNIIIKAIFIFGVDMQVQHRVGQSEYGLYFTLLNLCYIFQIINDFGLNLLHNTETAKAGRIRIERFYQILRLKILLACFYSFFIAIAAILLGYASYWQLLIWLVINNILVSLILVIRASLSGLGFYRKEAIISVMDKALMILLCGTLLLSFAGFDIMWFVWAQTASLVITVLVGIWMTMKYIDRNQTSVALSPLVIVFKDALPYTIATLLMFIYSRSDSILIEKLMDDGTYNVGIYAAAFRLLDAVNMIAFLFSPLLIPMYARLMNNRGETLQLLRLSGGMMIFMTAAISFVGFWWGESIMHALYPDANETWVLAFRILILTHIPIGLMYVYGSYLTAVGELGKQNRLFIFSVIISILLNVFVIPRWGVAGAAITSLITQSFTTLGLILIGHFHRKDVINLRRIMAIFLYLLVLVAAGWILTSMSFPWVIEILMFIGIALTAGFLTGLLELKGFLDLIKRREKLIT